MGPREAHELFLPVSERDHVRGGESALVQLLEYGDFECPFCARAHLIEREIEARLGDQLQFVFRDFPLPLAHPHAVMAAEAAECAAVQGGLWPMHDTLFENKDALELPDLIRYAEDLGLDVDRFTQDLLQHRQEARVREDFLSGVRSGVKGTPTFFIDGRRHDRPWDLPSLLGALEERIEAKNVRRRRAA
jgi:protein-disulfide isomerase